MGDGLDGEKNSTWRDGDGADLFLFSIFCLAATHHTSCSSLTTHPPLIFLFCCCSDTSQLGPSIVSDVCWQVYATAFDGRLQYLADLPAAIRRCLMLKVETNAFDEVERRNPIQGAGSFDGCARLGVLPCAVQSADVHTGGSECWHGKRSLTSCP